MKKMLSLISVLLVLISFASCSNEKAEKYCFSCGEGISKADTYCSYCGAKVGEERTEDNDEVETKADKTTSPVSTTAEVTEHIHDYERKVTPSTCTQKGFTEFICACGDTYVGDYTDAGHKYEKYVCVGCQLVDKAHAYEYFREWLLDNGSGNGRYIGQYNKINDDCYCYLLYDTVDKVLVVKVDAVDDMMITVELLPQNGKFHFKFVDNDYEHGETIIYGYVDGGTYTKDSEVTITEYIGENDLYLRVKYEELVQTCVAMAISYVEAVVDNVPGITLKDLGFLAFEA